MNPNIYSKYALEVKKEKISFTAILVGIYCMLVPIENVVSVIPGRSLNRYVGLFIILFEILSMLYDKRNVILYFKKGSPFIVFLVFAVLSVTWCTWYGEWQNEIGILFNNVVLLIIIINREYSTKETNFIKVLCGLMGIILALSIVAGTGLSMVRFGRYTISINGMLVDQNNLAISLTIPFFCIASFLTKQISGKGKKIALYLFLLLIIYAVFLSGSRSGLLGLSLGCVLALWRFSKKNLKKKLGATAILILVYCLFLLILSQLPNDISERFSLANVLENGASNRFTIWLNNLDIFNDFSTLQKLFGYGYGNSFELYFQHYGKYFAAHNDLIQMLIELGIVGVCCYLYILSYVLIKAVKSADPIALAMICAAIVGACSMEMLVKKMFWVMVFFALLPDKQLEVERLNA